MTKPDLTVCIPTYNRAGFLTECLTALLDQGLSATEYVVSISDNASTDNTPQVVESFRDRLQIQYHRRPSTVTALQNINGVTEQVKTPYVSVLCDDDLLAPGQLGRAMACLRKRPQASLYAALGMSQFRFGDQDAKALGMFLDMERVADEPFLFRWRPLPWLANCSLHTPMTIIGSVFKLDRVPQRPMFTAEFPQESDRLLFLRMVDSGEIYSAPWIGGHLRYHADQQSSRNTNKWEETERITQLTFEKAQELGYDLPQYWIDRLSQVDIRQLEFVCKRLRLRYPMSLSKDIMEKAGVYKRWKRLKKEQRREKRKSGHLPGLVGLLRKLLAK